MLGLGLQIDGRRVFDDALHGHLDELIETVELLAHQTFFVEIRIDDDPAGFLPDFVGNLLLIFRILFVRFDCGWYRM